MEQYIRRCFQLARLGAGHVSPNPLVGAVLMHADRIIGEGWHRRYGEAHAEVNAVQAVAGADRHLIPHSTLFCNLEPCFHFGKTPPCVDLILKEKVSRVVVSNTDPNPLVAGQSIQKLRAAGVEVLAGILEAEGRYLNRAFFTWIEKKRPHIILKWAQSTDCYLGRQGERTAITGPLAQRLVHRRRSEADAILVGTTTALVDNPRLDNRLYFGKSPLRIALDFAGKIPPTAHLLDDSRLTWIIGPEHSETYRKTQFLAPPETAGWIPWLIEKLTQEKHAILLVEGGANVLQQFLEAGLWDEILRLENPQFLHRGVPAPALPKEAVLVETGRIGDDCFRVFLKRV
ncbi:MAG: bifunctional diaminohydroxyphosphoribosylaminopyrimidine deaminase/5-amino-6-(5-phosphoribosylamino)uracil reductase RibD [Saprospiraceae bacterium]|jgi:diaminohydroxyphosphoribosylaminopyrimidine deaminase/5-amino-6-(5-phosphoribosylamino)uracil reductase|nr:bifunctional diaminohydroxyphosphoribosylaminopyrimidine deaminase/5-amino-6-(5-phosphoribosylamino)uracil reductase RibD [Saprospiraceae bacterium]